MRVGLTGGIASGKTEVSRLFSQHGIDIIDADLVARQVVEPGQPALNAIIEVFGTRVLDVDGRLDRHRMRERIFDDPESRAILEDIVHPRVLQSLVQQSGESDGPYCILCIPLLVENKLQSLVDRVLVVEVETAVQKQRLMARDHTSPDQVEAILAAQANRQQRLAAADDIIDNNGDRSRLPAQVKALHQRYLAWIKGDSAAFD